MKKKSEYKPSKLKSYFDLEKQNFLKRKRETILRENNA